MATPTTDRMNALMLDITLGRTVTPETEEEKVFVREVTKEIDQIKKSGAIVDVRPEWPDFD